MPHDTHEMPLLRQGRVHAGKKVHILTWQRPSRHLNALRTRIRRGRSTRTTPTPTCHPTTPTARQDSPRRKSQPTDRHQTPRRSSSKSSKHTSSRWSRNQSPKERTPHERYHGPTRKERHRSPRHQDREHYHRKTERTDETDRTSRKNEKRWDNRRNNLFFIHPILFWIDELIHLYSIYISSMNIEFHLWYENYRRHFQIYLQWKCLNFNYNMYNFTEVYSQGSNWL